MLAFITPLVFLIEKEVIPGLPLFVPQHLYFFFSLLILPAILHGASTQQAKISKWIIILLAVVTVNHLVAALVYGASYVGEIVPSLFRISYIYYVMWVVKLMISDERTLNSYISGLVVAFHLTLAVYLLQLVATFGFRPAMSLNNTLASIYEARWLPHEVMKGDVHLYYIDGSYASTQGRINGFSKEASTFGAGISLLFLPIFIPLAIRRYEGRNQKKFMLYSLLTIVMMMTAKASSGLIVGAFALFLIFIGKQRSVSMKFGVITAISMIFIVSFPFLMETEKIAKIGDMTNISTQTRAGTIISAIYTIANQPILGLGDNFYKNVYENLPSWAINYELSSYFTEDSLRVFLLPLSFYGEFGLFAFLIFSIFIFRIYKYSRSQRGALDFSRSSVGIFIPILLLDGLFLSSYLHPFLFLPMGIAYAMYKNKIQLSRQE